MLYNYASVLASKQESKCINKCRGKATHQGNTKHNKTKQYYHGHKRGKKSKNKHNKVTPNERRKMVMKWQEIGNKIQWKW